GVRAGAVDDHFVADLQAGHVIERDRVRSDGNIGVDDPMGGGVLLALGGGTFGRAVFFVVASVGVATDLDQRAVVLAGGDQDGALGAVALAAEDHAAVVEVDRAGDAVLAPG